MSVSDNMDSLPRAAVKLAIRRHPEKGVPRAQYLPPNPGDPDSFVSAGRRDVRHEGS